jgi:N-acetylmuramoyl-L-alanine amidase
MPKVAISHGHEMDTPGKRTPPIPELDNRVIHENEFNKATAMILIAVLTRCGFETKDVSETNNDTLKDRKDRANEWGADIFIAIHYNAFDGKFDGEGKDPEGHSIYIYPGSKEGRRLAECILKYLVQGTPQINRGIKEKGFYVLKYTRMPAILSENGFMDNKREALLMLNANFQEEVAVEHAKGICDYFGMPYIEEEVKHNILVTASLKQAQEWARKKGATKEFIELAPYFWRLAPEQGIDPAGAYAQSAKETGFGNFGGVLDASFYNPCGMKTTEGGGNYDKDAHQRFKNWEQGIQAQIDHLALYAGAPGYPKKYTPDPRHFSYLINRAPTWEDLGGKWAGSSSYGTSIVKMVAQMRSTEEPEPVKPIEEPAQEEDVSDWAKSAWEKAKLKKINGLPLNDGAGAKNPVTEEQLMVFFDLLGLLD